jgi:lipoic acid synthetase
VIYARPTVINHNIETVPRLYLEVRPKAAYQRSLQLLARVKETNPLILTKSGFMVGLGESRKEIIEVMHDLRSAQCDLLTIGQYLQPSFNHHEVLKYIPPEEFKEYESIGRELGFTAVVAGPLVRSSFHAADMFLSA